MTKSRKTFTTAFDTYTEVELIGSGGNGQVYKVTDPSGKIYAIKLLDEKKARGDSLRRFKNELFFCLRNKHENIIHVLDYGIILSGDIQTPFYVMNYYEKTLGKLLLEKMSGAIAIKLFLKILDGVEAAHLLRVWHRDLKPENILIHPEQDQLVVADFGIACFTVEEMHTIVETKLGDRLANFKYAAPEQRKKDGKVDERTDIFALGLILNEMFTNEVIQGTGCKQIADVDPSYAYLDPIVEKMVRNNPGERYKSIDEIKQHLIGYRLEFVSRQKLDQLKKEVVPENEISDPLVNDPVKIIGFEPRPPLLILKLNQSINSEWSNIIRNGMSNYLFSSDIHPRKLDVREDTITINIDVDRAQVAVNYIKSWIEITNTIYKNEVIEKSVKRKHDQELELIRRREAEEKRNNLLKTLKI